MRCRRVADLYEIGAIRGSGSYPNRWLLILPIVGVNALDVLKLP
jgi:hypothetical protein